MGEMQATPEQIAASERAIDGLAAQADIWADEIDLVVIIKSIGAASRALTDRMPTDVREGFINRQEANVDALARQAYLEGFMRGGDSRKDYDEAQLTAATSLHAELVAALTELHAMVRGECPSLLDEDSGGSARLDMEITALLQKAKQQ